MPRYPKRTLAVFALTGLAWSVAGARAGIEAASGTAPTGSTTTIVSMPGLPPDLLPPGLVSTTSTTTSSTTTSSTTTSTTSSTTTTTLPSCDGTRNRGRTDVGVTGRRITLGAVTVDSGIATGFLGGETVALQAVIDRVNADGGVCGKELVLETRDSGWEPNAGYEAIRDLSDEVLALVVNPDSNGLSLASLREACNEEPACDARAIAGLPSTVVNWLARGGAGVVAKTAGAVAVPPLLFHEDFAQSCGRDCDRLRLWTAFRPPIHPFLGEPAVARYVNDMRVVSSYVDVENQHTQGAYVGAELAVHALRHAAARPGGITRENVAHVLATTTNWDSGLTVAPLSWSPGEHNAATTLHAYDIRFSPTTATVEFWYVDGSRRTSPA